MAFVAQKVLGMDKGAVSFIFSDMTLRMNSSVGSGRRAKPYGLDNGKHGGIFWYHEGMPSKQTS